MALPIHALRAIHDASASIHLSSSPLAYGPTQRSFSNAHKAPLSNLSFSPCKRKAKHSYKELLLYASQAIMSMYQDLSSAMVAQA